VIPLSVLLVRGDRSGAQLRDLAPQANESQFHSVSHTRQLSAIAWSSVRVGVDIEIVRPRVHLTRLARRSMTDDEYERWQRAGESERDFLQHWTRVEAYLKAIGTGVRGGLRARPPSNWRLVDLELTSDDSATSSHDGTYVGAVAVEAPDPLLSVRWWGSARGTSG